MNPIINRGEDNLKRVMNLKDRLTYFRKIALDNFFDVGPKAGIASPR